MSQDVRHKGKETAQGRRRVRRQEVERDDGWTVITHGISKMRVSDTRTDKSWNNKSRSSEQHTNGLPSQVVQNLTATKLRQQFQKMQEQYDGSEVANHISGILNKRNPKVRDAACIGIGSFSRDWEHRHRSLWQLVLFIDVVEKLSNVNGQIQLHAQDPAFTALDLSFLELLNVNVITEGVADHISSTTFVFSPFVDWFILLPVFLQTKTPALYIGNEILDDYTAFAQSEEKQQKLEECNKLGKAFVRDQDCVKLKDFEHHAHALNGVVIYIRKQEAEMYQGSTRNIIAPDPTAELQQDASKPAQGAYLL